MFMNSMQRMIHYDINSQHLIYNINARYSPVNLTKRRNEIVRQFVESAVTDWLIMVDADMIVPYHFVETMLASANGDPDSEDYTAIISGLAFTPQGDNIYPVMCETHEGDENEILYIIEDYPRDSLIKVDAVGASCLMMHRPAMIKMLDEYGERAFPWFEEIKYKGQIYGEDLGFSIKARQIGLPIYVNTAAKVGHYKPLVLGEHMYDRQLLTVPVSHDHIRQDEV